MGCSSSGAAPAQRLLPAGGSDRAASSSAKPKLKRALTLESGMVDDASGDEESFATQSADSSSEGGERAFPTECVVLQSSPPSKPGHRRHGSAVAPASDGFALPGIQAVSMKGQKAESPNQDAWIVVRPGNGFSVYGVFDGHGKAGHDVSHFVKSILPKTILDDPRLGKSSQMVHVMGDAFARMAEQVAQATQSGKLKAQKSGTTATVVVHDHANRMLTISHVGDSGCAIASGSSWKAKYLTPDHKPNLAAEAQRIYKASGAITYDGYNYRIHKKGAYGPQLNMSRSFGDLWAHEVGLISTPDTVQVKVGTSDHLIVLCSDGVWEHMKAQDAVDTLRHAFQRRPDNAAHELGCAASDLWAENHESGTVDDITVLLVKLQEQPGALERGRPRQCDSLSESSITMDSGGIRSLLRRSDSKASLGSGAQGARASGQSHEYASPRAKPALRRADSSVSQGSQGPQVRSALKRSSTQVCAPSRSSLKPCPRAQAACAEACRRGDARTGRSDDEATASTADRTLTPSSEIAGAAQESDEDHLLGASGESSPEVSQSVRRRPWGMYFAMPEHSAL